MWKKSRALSGELKLDAPSTMTSINPSEICSVNAERQYRCRPCVALGSSSMRWRAAYGMGATTSATGLPNRRAGASTFSPSAIGPL